MVVEILNNLPSIPSNSSFSDEQSLPAPPTPDLNSGETSGTHTNKRCPSQGGGQNPGSLVRGNDWAGSPPGGKNDEEQLGNSNSEDNLNLNDDTILYFSPMAFYIEELNGDEALRPPPGDVEKEQLDLALLLATTDPDTALEISNKYVLSIMCNYKETAKNQTKTYSTRKKVAFLSNKKRRKAEYAALQRLYKKKRQSAYRKIFEVSEISPGLGRDNVFMYWSKLFTCTDLNRTTNSYTPYPFALDLNELADEVSFIVPEEVKKAKLPTDSACGPDGLSVKSLNRIPVRIRCKLFTLWLLLGQVLPFILDSKTIFIPKKECSHSPADLRPISISSVLCRQFHKVLATRLSSIISRFPPV